ncbi:MaoC family dehydratase [Sphingomonas sp.]|uniref:MaoC family dehydratase n=1 Tax=Sphingomonas sp. TaxID=28214 RepID=UPI002CCE67D0|nr:MaoC family dehydratase [Sphingomonas sp.]HTG39512.1 MaoC family dehydratase [Sphingomonas sp.]
MPVTISERASQIGVTCTSDWVTVDQAMIDTFANATGDDQFIHVDPVRAAQTPFGGTIAHGFLTLSLMPMLAARTPGLTIDGARMGVNYGGNRVRFLTPVKSGARVRGHFKLLALAEKRPREWQQTTEFTVEIEGEVKPALIAEWISLIFI